MDKQKIEKLIKMKGKVRGVVFETDARYVLEKKGKEGLAKVKKETKRLGHLIDYEKIRPLDWYSAGLRALSLIAIKNAFNWGDKEIFDMGNNAPKFSIIVKMLLKYFVSLKKSISQIPVYWNKHWTVGKIECPEFHEKDKWLVIRICDIKLHPLFCVYEAGYFLRIAQYVIKSSKIENKEIKCMHKEDPYHDFLIKWQ